VHQANGTSSQDSHARSASSESPMTRSNLPAERMASAEYSSVTPPLKSTCRSSRMYPPSARESRLIT